MSAHPLLTKVLAEMLANGPDWESEGYPFIFLSTGLLDRCVAAIPPAIADRLERALDVCQYPQCDRRESDLRHHHSLCIAPPPHPERHDDIWCHPYQPLVAP